jgi:hypothetical protein
MHPQHRNRLSWPDECVSSAQLTYCLIRAEGIARKRFLVSTILKVPGGVRYTKQWWPKRPDETELIRECEHVGYFSPRPYRLGQDADDSTLVCVMALNRDLCSARTVDATHLLSLAYPKGEVQTRLTAHAWNGIRESAEWQGTEFPATWTGSHVTALSTSLRSQGHGALVPTLERHIEALSAGSESSS